MKKYIAPTLTVTSFSEEFSLMATSLQRRGSWGGDEEQSFANKDWQNQGFKDTELYGGVTIEDDNGDLNSYSKENGDLVGEE